MRNTIDEFRGRYFFLSNFYAAPVVYQDALFKNNEAAFQSAKCPERMLEFCILPPNRAKALGRRVKLRPDWETVKYDVMYDICMAKFTQNPDLLTKLLDTGDAELIEGNTWGVDLYRGIGENHLGKILMRVREELSGIVDKFCEAPGYSPS